MSNNNDKPVYENPWLEMMRMVLAFVVKMKWALLIAFGVVVAWKLGLSPEVILDWMAKVFGTAIGAE